jgi:hypothetical protein
MIFYYLFALLSPLALSMYRRGDKHPFGSHSYLAMREFGVRPKFVDPMTLLSDLILKVFEENKVEDFDRLLSERSSSYGIGIAVNQEFPMRELKEGEIGPAPKTTLKELLKRENLFVIFAKYKWECEFVKDIIKSLEARARDYNRGISIMGFINRLEDIYLETEHLEGHPLYVDLYKLLLDYALGNRVTINRLGIFPRLNLLASTTFGRDVIGQIFPKNWPLGSINPEKLQWYFRLLVFSKAEIKFATSFLNDFLETRLVISGDLFMNEVIFEIQRTNSFLKPFAEHRDEIVYRRLIRLMEFYLKNIREPSDAIRTEKKCIKYLQRAPNLPVPVMNLLFSYYMQTATTPHEEVVDMILKLSGEERTSIMALQSDPAYNGVSDSTCVNPSEILESLLQIGCTEFDGSLFALAKFSIPFFLDPFWTLEEFLVALEEEAKTNDDLRKALSYIVQFKHKSSSLPLGNLKSSIFPFAFQLLRELRFEKAPLLFRYFLRDLVKIHIYPDLDLFLFLKSFKTEVSQKQFLEDLWNVKNGIGIGFTRVFFLFPLEHVKTLKQDVNFRKDYTYWIKIFAVLFKRYIINKNLTI